MMKKATLVVIVLALVDFTEIKGNPLNKTEAAVKTEPQRGSRILRKGDWFNFHGTWTFPSLPSVASLFHSQKKEAKAPDVMKTRIQALEDTQRDIVEMLKKMTKDMKPLPFPCADQKPEDTEKEKELASTKKPEYNEKNEPAVTIKNIISENATKTEFKLELKPELSQNQKDNEVSSSEKEVLGETSTKIAADTENPTSTKKYNETSTKEPSVETTVKVASSADSVSDNKN